ncbi:unknown [Coraliomargarita sp. CAG:312]|jgi:hypothetical protein|nr:unknown [Coraliomargarita sp. CAG:312]
MYSDSYPTDTDPENLSSADDKNGSLANVFISAFSDSVVSAAPAKIEHPMSDTPMIIFFFIVLQFYCFSGFPPLQELILERAAKRIKQMACQKFF